MSLNNWYRKARLVDKDPSANVTYVKCVYCKKYATFDPSNPGETIWKTVDEMDEEEKGQVEEGEGAMGRYVEEMGISHGICPSCYPRVLEEVKRVPKGI